MRVLDLSDLSPYLLENLPEHLLLDEIRKISEMLTVKRQKISTKQSYVLNEKAVSAYALFYLPTHLPKIDFLLSKIPLLFLKEMLQRPFIDFGTGPGTFLLALSFFLEKEGLNIPPLWAVDHSNLMLAQAQKITEGFKIKANFLPLDSKAKLPLGANLFFGHSLNEMGLDHISLLINQLKPSTVFFVEPGTKDFFKKALELRDLFSSLGFHSVYPCAHLDRPCPLQKEDDWCHQIVRYSLPFDLARISQKAQLNRGQMSMTAHVYSKNKIAVEEWALIRFKGESKFSYEWLGCLGKNNDNYICQLTFLKKDHKNLWGEGVSYKKFFDDLSVGDRPQLEILKQKSEDHFVVKLIR